MKTLGRSKTGESGDVDHETPLFLGGDFTDFDQLGEHGDFTMNSGDVNQRRSTSWREPATHWGDLMGQLSNHQGQVTDLQDPTGIRRHTLFFSYGQQRCKTSSLGFGPILVPEMVGRAGLEASFSGINCHNNRYNSYNEINP